MSATQTPGVVTLYVAGPMTGLVDFNYPAFNTAAQQLRNAGYAVLNPVDSKAENTTGESQTWEWYLRRALRMVTRADGIALLPGWEGSRGARLEVEVARELGMWTRDLPEWLAVLRTT